MPDVRALAAETLALLGADPDAVTDDDVEIDTRWLGPDYGEPTAAGDEAIRWAAVHGGWVLDRTYSGKGLAGLLGNAVEGRWRPGTEVVFLHTGGLPAVFAPGGVASSVRLVSEILDVDLLAFERGSGEQRRAVVDGVRRSLETGFVYTSHDLSEDLLDRAYGMLKEFFAAPAEEKQRWVVPGVHGQTGYTGLLVETAASSDVPDWKEMLNWSAPIPSGHPLKRKFPTAYPDQVLPEETVPGITKVLTEFHETIADLQRRFLRVIAEGIGCHETFFDEMVTDGPTLTRAIRYPPMGETPGDDAYEWAGQHGDINLITALPRATAPGLQVKVDGEWVDAVAPEGRVIINTGIMLERLSNGQIPIGWHRVVAAPGYTGERHSVVQFCHPRPWTVLAPGAELLHAGAPAAVRPDHRRRRPRRGALRDQSRGGRPPGLIEALRRRSSAG